MDSLWVREDDINHDTLDGGQEGWQATRKWHSPIWWDQSLDDLRRKKTKKQTTDSENRWSLSLLLGVWRWPPTYLLLENDIEGNKRNWSSQETITWKKKPPTCFKVVFVTCSLDLARHIWSQRLPRKWVSQTAKNKSAETGASGMKKLTRTIIYYDAAPNPVTSSAACKIGIASRGFSMKDHHDQRLLKTLNGNEGHTEIHTPVHHNLTAYSHTKRKVRQPRPSKIFFTMEERL